MADQSIKVLITGDGAQLSKALNTASSQIAAFGTKAGASLKRLGSQLGTIGAIGGGALAVWAKRNIDALDELGKASIRTGVAVEDLAKLRYAGQLADVDIPSLDKALARLNKTLGEARQGNQAAIKALADLGITATDSVLPAMGKVADTLAALPDSADRAARMSAVFGKEWATLVPMLENGGGELQRLGDELQRLGGVPTKQATDAAQEFNDNITRIGIALAGPFNAAMRDILPPLAAISQSFVNASNAAGGFYKLFENFGAKIGLQARLAVINTEFERLRSSIDYINSQMAKGYLERTPERQGELDQGVGKLKALSEEITRIEAKLAELNQKPDIADLTIGVITDPMAVQNVTAGAVQAVQAAQPNVPTLLVPMAIVPAAGGMGPGVPITSYEQLQQEFLRQNAQSNAAGGLISGPGSGTSDSVLSWLSNGEYVVRAAAVNHYGASLLRAINSMSLPRFANGGQVSMPIYLNNRYTGTASAASGDAGAIMRAFRRASIQRAPR